MRAPLVLREGVADVWAMNESTHAAPRRDNDVRRRNPHLRELVDELMASIRVASNKELWSDDERTKYEADMVRIMEDVRQHAMQGRRGGTG